MDKQNDTIEPASDIDLLRNALEHGWDEDTTTDPDNWTADNPAYGQCAVTACVIQDYLGGEIVNAYVEEPTEDEPVSHYFNDIDGVVVDMTAQQFSDEAEIPRGTPKPKEFNTTRNYVLSYEPTQERYEILSERVDEFFTGEEPY